MKKITVIGCSIVFVGGIFGMIIWNAMHDAGDIKLHPKIETEEYSETETESLKEIIVETVVSDEGKQFVVETTAYVADNGESIVETVYVPVEEYVAPKGTIVVSKDTEGHTQVIATQESNEGKVDPSNVTTASNDKTTSGSTTKAEATTKKSTTTTTKKSTTTTTKKSTTSTTSTTSATQQTTRSGRVIGTTADSNTWETLDPNRTTQSTTKYVATTQSTYSGTYGDFSYYHDEGGAITITGYNGAGGNITIPSQIDNCNVVAIKDKAFFGKSAITGITIPDTVKNVGICSFAGICSNGSISVSLPSNLRSIGDGAFAGINVTSANSAYTLDRGCVYANGKLLSASGLFSDSSATHGTYVVMSGTTEIASFAFYGCSAIGNIKFPDSLNELNVSSFQGCTGLGPYINLPAGVTYIDAYCFADCYSLTRVYMMYQRTGKEGVVSSSAFGSNSNVTVYGPDNSTYN